MHPENQGNVNKLRFSPAHYLAKDTVAHLMALTEAEILNCDRYLPGYTKKDSRAVVYAFMKTGMNFTAGADLINEYANDESQTYTFQALRKRAEKIFKRDLVVENLYWTYRGFRSIGKGFQPLSWLLNPTRKPDPRGRTSTLRMELSCRICQEMVAEHGSIAHASQSANVPVAYLHHWLGIQNKKA